MNISRKMSDGFKTQLTFLAVLTLAGLLMACSSIDPVTPTTPSEGSLVFTTPTNVLPSATATSTALPTPEIINPAPVGSVIGDAARNDLASRLGMDITSISVAEIVSQDWPDACLGLAPVVGQECVKNNVPGWRVVLNAAGHTHEYRATADGKLVSYSGPVGFGVPKVCTITGTSPIYSPEDGYCFAYPVRFHRNDDRSPIGIYGPAYGPGPEPLCASLSMEITDLADGQTLNGAVDAFLARLGSVTMPQTRQAFTIDNEPAIMLEVVPGMFGSRDVFVIHKEKLFHLTFWPAPSVTAETAVDVEDLYQTAIISFNFQPLSP